MKIIEKIEEFIEEELEGAENYIKCALNLKGEFPELAKTYYDLSIVETGHSDTLHNQIVRLIDKYKASEGAPPADMLAVYNYLHERYIKWYNKIKLMQAEYR